MPGLRWMCKSIMFDFLAGRSCLLRILALGLDIKHLIQLREVEGRTRARLNFRVKHSAWWWSLLADFHHHINDTGILSEM